MEQCKGCGAFLLKNKCNYCGNEIKEELTEASFDPSTDSVEIIIRALWHDPLDNPLETINEKRRRI